MVKTYNYLFFVDEEDFKKFTYNSNFGLRTNDKDRSCMEGIPTSYPAYYWRSISWASNCHDTYILGKPSKSTEYKQNILEKLNNQLKSYEDSIKELKADIQTIIERG